MSSGLVRAASESTEDEDKGFYCYPGEDGQSWVCDKGVHNKPVRQIRSTTPAAGVKSREAKAGQLENNPRTAKPANPPVRSEHSTTQASAAQAEGQRIAGDKAEAGRLGNGPTAEVLRWNEISGSRSPEVSNNPQDWYTPAQARAIDAQYRPVEDLAAQLYVQDPDPAGYCAGGYVQRDYPYPVDVDNESFPIIAEADSLSSEIDVTAQLVGNVSVAQGNRLIRAPLADLDQVQRVGHFPQGVRMDQPGLIMQGEQAVVHLDSQEADLQGVQFVITDAGLRGEARQMQQSSGGDLALAHNSFTRCEPDNNGWRLNTRNLLIEQDEVFGTAKHAVLRLKRVPVFYTPYLKFPVSDERVSGFLFPTLGYSDEDGAEVSLPYYFNLAPNYDATFVPRYFSKRGASGELEVRHMSSWQTTAVGGALLPDDDLYNGTLSRKDFDEFVDDMGNPVDLGVFEPADRWLGALDHRGRFGRFRTFADINMVSDPDYFRDLGSDLNVSSQIELERRAEIQYVHSGLSVRLWGQRFQRLDQVGVDDYERLPELELLYSTDLGPLELGVSATWADFDRDTTGLNGLNAVTGERTHIEPRVSLPMSWPFGFLNLTGGYRYTRYDLEQDSNAAGFQLVDDKPDRNIGLASVDGGLIFERDINWFDQALVQTLEPRVYYLWQEFDDQAELPRFDASVLTFGYQQLFRNNRFSGLDRIGDANQASVGVTTRFLAEETGREYFRFSVGEIFYFENRKVTLAGGQTAFDRRSQSAVAAEISASIAQHWRLTGTTLWDPYDNEVDEGGAALQYRRDNRHIFNLGFRNRRDQDIEQTDVSLYWPISRQFSIIGRWNYDLVSGRTIEGFGGIEYNDCCLQIRLLARRFLDSPAGTVITDFDEADGDDGIFLQVVFKGLAGFGTKIEGVLENGISGYRSPEQQDYFSNGSSY